MYDFFFGSREEIAQNETKFLISVKRMMPRWVNSIPDSEFLSIAALLDSQGRAASEARRHFVAVETGAGASTLAFAFYALKYDGLALSWDYNAEKGSLIRTVCTETMGNVFEKHVQSHWKLVAHDSLSPYVGLAILPDLVDHVDLYFHDSEHTWNTIRRELETVTSLLSENAVVALDDANLTYVHTNTGYINTLRQKLGLPPVPPPEGNVGLPFYREAERFLQTNWEQVDPLPDQYKENFQRDPYFAYYDAEFNINAALGMVRREGLEHRFDSWRVAKRRGTLSPKSGRVGTP